MGLQYHSWRILLCWRWQDIRKISKSNIFHFISRCEWNVCQTWVQFILERFWRYFLTFGIKKLKYFSSRIWSSGSSQFYYFEYHLGGNPEGDTSRKFRRLSITSLLPILTVLFHTRPKNYFWTVPCCISYQNIKQWKASVSDSLLKILVNTYII